MSNIMFNILGWKPVFKPFFLPYMHKKAATLFW